MTSNTTSQLFKKNKLASPTKQEIVMSKSARDQLIVGIKKLADTVVCTLGPSGRNVIINVDENKNPVSTKDGVTVAENIVLKHPVENIGAQLVKQASSKTNKQAGDGTTTSTLLASSILTSGLEVLNNPKQDIKLNVTDIKSGLEKTGKVAIDYIKENIVKQVKNKEQLKQVATISANGDEHVAELVFRGIDKVGLDGIVIVEESNTGESYLDVVEGIQFDRGFKSPFFITDNENMQAVLEDPLILITTKRLTQIRELLPLLEDCSTQSKSLLIIADDIDGAVLSTLIVNKQRGILNCVAVKAPEFGDRKKEVLEDIATLTGAKVVSSEAGMKLDLFDRQWLGRCKKITVTKDTTTIVDAKGSESEIIQRVNQIKKQIENTKSSYEIETLQSRLARFIGGVSILFVGGKTEVELKETKDRVDDALHATRAAIEEGIVPGSGLTLYKTAYYLMQSDTKKALNLKNDSEVIGYNILLHALTQPFLQILNNAGYDEHEVHNTVKLYTNLLINEESVEDFTFDVKKDIFGSMFNLGVIDPAKVVRLALQNAISVAGTVLTTEAVIPYRKPKKFQQPNLINQF